MGTNFDDMSHERMLQWLDAARSGEIQGAADRLASAATEIRKIAEDLKVRPQWVEWKGAGADAFRTWSADLANSTLRLGDYSEGASQWLARASDAIASAQASIPRTHAGAQADLDAALAARNDPDASAVAKRSAETLIATNQANRDEAAREMRKLAQSYEFSSSQMNVLEKPVFPPPPEAIAPPSRGNRNEGTTPEFGNGAAAAGTAYGAGTERQGVDPGKDVTALPGSPGVSAPSVTPGASQPVGMAIDGAGVLTDAPSAPATILPRASGGGSADGGSTPAVPVLPGSGPVASPGANTLGRPTGMARPSVRPPVGRSPGSGIVGRPSPEGGIVGGRPVPQSPGRPTGGLPRGTVAGGEGMRGGRAPMGHGAGVGGTGGGQNGIIGGRRLAGEPGGVVGGRGRQAGGTSTRPFTPGGSGLVRGAASAEGARVAGPMGRGGVSPGSRPSDSRDGEGGQRPDYLTEDEETWQQGARRVVPPVVD
ncbi:hypothetical protein LRD69_11295 [Streptomyces sp. JH14]|uniref:WXG100 family type VII secretion target n=1 Tax=Streptomyces sp. JH14 TaxID=2793630 RepID=UPI0023F8DA7C|nr:hypothetical protein [Streptomyces sp. JH14]MDF6042733.1 hypothetical protein [Streptomyces sp. JH14]